MTAPSWKMVAEFNYLGPDWLNPWVCKKICCISDIRFRVSIIDLRMVIRSWKSRLYNNHVISLNEMNLNCVLLPVSIVAVTPKIQ